MAFALDGKSFLTGSGGGNVFIWDLKGNILQKLKGHFKFIFSVAFSPDKKYILTGANDSTARLWRITKPEDAFLKNNRIEKFLNALNIINKR